MCVCALVGCNKNHIKLQGTVINIKEGQQARIHNSYKNTKVTKNECSHLVQQNM
jgi:hypothetical protein